MKAKSPAPERFWSKVGRGIGPDACWPWLAARLPPLGYGSVRWKGASRRAHRIAWEIANGPIPAGLWVLHTCDNPPCCNPAHLWLGTHHDNMTGKARKGRASNTGAAARARTHCKRGHEYTPENTYWRPIGTRVCRTCRASWLRLASQKKASE